MVAYSTEKAASVFALARLTASRGAGMFLIAFEKRAKINVAVFTFRAQLGI